MFGNVLGCAEDGQDIVFKDDAALEINHVRVADRAVGRQFDRRTLDEITGGHDDLIGIARHIVGNGCDLGVEQASPEAIRLALSKVRCATYEPQATFTMQDISAAGLNGTPDAADRRAEVGAILGIGYGNAKQFLKRLNHYGVTRDEWDDALRQIHEVK